MCLQQDFLSVPEDHLFREIRLAFLALTRGDLSGFGEIVDPDDTRDRHRDLERRCFTERCRCVDQAEKDDQKKEFSNHFGPFPSPLIEKTLLKEEKGFFD